jgi:hypothetical protein
MLKELGECSAFFLLIQAFLVLNEVRDFIVRENFILFDFTKKFDDELDLVFVFHF